MSIRPWAVWRRIQYGFGFLVFWALVGTAFYFAGFYQSPTCFDGKMNGTERGIDCGGDCVLVCALDAAQPHVTWVKSFEVSDGQYNAVAYVENLNQTVGTPALEYNFEFYSDGTLIGERAGQAELPPNSLVPLFAGRVLTENNTKITETKLEIKPVENWLPATFTRDQFRSVDINLTSSDAKPRLNVSVQNNALVPAEDIEVVATVFNGSGDPVTASQTFIENIGARSNQEIVFTWPNPISRTITSCIIPTDIAMAIDLSGSMNNDGDNPPQPLTDTLVAASEFVSGLSKEDQIAIITFATEGKVAYPLAKVGASTASSVLELEIGEADESGFTNTLAALELAEAELNSANHNTNARKVLVLLTDGLPTTAGDEDILSLVEAKASQLDEEDIKIYAIGLGQAANRDFISSIASDEISTYFAPTGADLKSIYKEITTSICEVGPTKIDIIAKPKVDFAEIR